MSSRGEVAKLNWPRWQQALLIAVLLLVIGVRLVMLGDSAVSLSGLNGEVGTIGGQGAPNSEFDAGFGKLFEVYPDGPLAKAGASVGDHIRFEPAYMGYGQSVVGQTFEVTLDHNGVRSSRQLTIAPWHPNATVRQALGWLALNLVAAILSVLIGCFILWRGWGHKTAMLLGASLICMTVVNVRLPGWASAPALAVPMWAVYGGGGLLAGLLPAFAMQLHEETGGVLPRWQWRALRGLLALFAALAPVLIWSFLTVTAIPILGNGLRLAFAFQVIAYCGCIGYLISAWRRAKGGARNRTVVIIFALVAYLLATIAGIVLIQGALTIGQIASTPFAALNALTQGVLAPGLLAYAVLRHKLFDLGFAVNRTLVFATISAVLLVSFGTLEWAVDHLVPEAWHKGSAIYSAGIAVGLFLLFHRIRDFVEQIIERLFFRGWHHNEAALKRFVGAAAHVERPAALAGQFVAELARFSGGAAVALYVRRPEGDYANATGETIDADDPALAAMRAEQAHIVPAEVGSQLCAAALALPMLHQAALAGFVLLGPKPTREDYRPDEIEVVGWATQQVGLDLQAIRVRELELANVKLMARNQTLSEILQNATLAKA